MSTTRPAGPIKGQRPEDEKYSWTRTYLYGLQHIMTMYGGIIAPPFIVGNAAGLGSAEIGILISAALLVGGVATVLQTVGFRFFGSQLPLVQGVSFASVSTMSTIATDGGGLTSVFGSILVAGALGFLITPVFSHITRFFPPVVTGTIITVIGLSLLPTGVEWMMGEDEADSGWGSIGNIGLAAFTLVVVLLLSRFLQGVISRLSILLGLVIGTVFAAILGKADFSELMTHGVFAVPTPFEFGAPTFEIGAIISMFVVILVIMTETTADMIAVGEIVGTEVDTRRVADGLRADMGATVLAPIFNTFPASAFAQNVGLVAITGIRSRWAVAAGGSVLFVLGLFPVLGQVVAAIPSPVLGGAGLVLFGSVAVSGIRTLSKVEYEGNLNLTLVATSIAIGVIPIAVPDFYSNFPTWFAMIFESGISAASIAAVVLNILFNEIRWGRRKDPSVFTAGSSARLVVAADEQRSIADRDAEQEQRRSVERQVRIRSGHGRRSGCCSHLDTEGGTLESIGAPNL